MTQLDIPELNTTVPTPPSTSDATNFRARADAFLAFIPTFWTVLTKLRTQLTTLINEMNGASPTIGNANKAIALYTPRTINGVSFDGSADITVADATKHPLFNVLGIGNGGTGTLNGFAQAIKLPIGTDSATLIDTGDWYIYDGVGAPTGGGYYYHIIRHSDDYVAQIAISSGTGNIAGVMSTRIKFNGVWGLWQKQVNEAMLTAKTYASPWADVATATSYPITHNLNSDLVQLIVQVKAKSGAFADIPYEIGTMFYDNSSALGTGGVARKITGLNTVALVTANTTSTGLGFFTGTNDIMQYANGATNPCQMRVVITKLN